MKSRTFVPNFRQNEAEPPPGQYLDPAVMEILQRIDVASKIPLAHSVAYFFFSLIFFLLVGYRFDWIRNILTPILLAWVVAFVNYFLSNRKWHILVNRVLRNDMDGDGNPDSGEKYLVFVIRDEKTGHEQSHYSKISETDKDNLLKMARAFNSGMSTSQGEMGKRGIGQRKWRKYMDFLEKDLQIVQKTGPNDNDPYEVKPDSHSRQVMSQMAYGQFETVDERWGG